MDLKVEMGDVQTFDRLKDRLIQEAGLQVEVLSATSHENTVMGRLKIGHKVNRSGKGRRPVR